MNYLLFLILLLCLPVWAQSDPINVDGEPISTIIVNDEEATSSGGSVSIATPRGVIFDAGLSANVGIPEAITNIVWDEIVVDTFSGWNASLGCYTLNTNHGGVYRINVWAASDNVKQDFWLSTNGVTDESVADYIATVSGTQPADVYDTCYMAGWISGSTNASIYTCLSLGGAAGASPGNLYAFGRYIDIHLTRIVIEEIAR